MAEDQGKDVKRRGIECFVRSGTLVLCALVCCLNSSHAQEDRVEPGHSIGNVSTDGNLVVVELEDGALGKANLFDLVGQTLRFMPDGSQYRADHGPLNWDSNFGSELTGAKVTLHQFTFPFSGKKWDSLFVGATGSISFGPREKDDNPDGPRRPEGGVSIGRFEPLAEAVSTLLDQAPAMCVFFKPRMSGPHYVKELADRVVVTWDTTEPFGNIQDFTWFKTINRFQLVLHRDGLIEMSYKELAAKDAIVGIYPEVSGTEKALATFGAEPHPALPAHLDLRNLKVSIEDGIRLKVTFETRGPALHEGDPAVDGLTYRILFDAQKPSSTSAGAPQTKLTWTGRGIAWHQRPSRYIAFGPGVSRKVVASGNTITLEGMLPSSLRGVDQVSVSAEVAASGNPEPVAKIPPHVVRLSGIRNPEVHLSSLARKDGPLRVAYEAFHYMTLPRPQDLSCTVIKALGDKFDFLAYYSDFRIDNQEAGTPSDGPKAGNVLGTGEGQHDLESYCSKGRFQWGYVQPVYVGANQMQEWPPDGAPVGSDHDITFYLHQLGERSLDGKILPYNYAMSQIGHEMGHRWAAFVSAKVNGQAIQLGPVHWARGLQAPVAFPYQRPTEASAMGGGVWQDNFDGTYTQLDDDYYVPATGYSYLDLYLMGLISAAEVPDFFILQNLVPVGKDANGHPLFKADRTKIKIEDVIAAEGPRLPDVGHSQKKFNTGIVVVVEPGHVPSPELLERANGIRLRWIDYWETTTGHRASMTTNPR
jgi:endonuclease YncB( thermonuclease family)